MISKQFTNVMEGRDEVETNICGGVIKLLPRTQFSKKKKKMIDKNKEKKNKTKRKKMEQQGLQILKL